jgi:hypothetical protein
MEKSAYQTTEEFISKNLTSPLPQEENLTRDISWLYHHSEWPFFELNLSFPHKEILHEAKNLIDDFIVPDYGKKAQGRERGIRGGQGWELLFIHGLGKHHINRAFAYGHESEDLAPYTWTEVANSCPTTKVFLNSLPYKKLFRAWFAMLRPNGFVAPHIGRNKSGGFNHKMTFALNHPKGFLFAVEGFGRIPWAPGKGFLVKADQYYHATMNRGIDPRIHLITTGVPDWPKLEKVLIRKRD